MADYTVVDLADSNVIVNQNINVINQGLGMYISSEMLRN